MFKHEYDQLIREHFDLTDSYTRKYITSLKEDAQQDQLLNALSSALYEKIVSKVDDIDFGTIPLSRGDITKVQGFASTEECLNIIRNLVIQYKQNPTIVDVVISAVNNIIERKALFIKGYALNAELPMLIYNTMVLAIERSTSLLIATCIEYIKDPATNNMKMALDKAAYSRTMDDLLFKQLINFNNMCHNGQLDKTLEAVMKNGLKFAKEEVENMYRTIHPLDEEDPTSPEMPVNNDESPFDFDSTVEPASNNEPETSDTEIPAPNEFPEETPEDVNDEPGGILSPEDLRAAGYNGEPATEPSDDEVEPDNIPAVNPGDDVVASDTPINELDDDEDETNDPTPFVPESDEPVDEIAPVAIALGIAGLGALAASAIPALLKLVIGLLRTTIYYFYYSKMKLADTLAVQADLIEANANELQYSTTTELSDKERNNAVKKQMKWAQRLRKWANKFAIDSKSASNQAKKQADADDKNKNTIRPNDNGDDAIW